MYKSDLVDTDYEQDNLLEPVFELEPDAWLELDLLSNCID